MFGGSSSDTTAPVVAGTTEEDISTNQEAIPIPYLTGTQKAAVRWISGVYNQYNVEVPLPGGKGGDKKGGGQGTGTYDYFGSIAGVVCLGQVDELVAIAIDGEQVWALGNVFRIEQANPFVGSIPGKGNFRFYWGTEDQTLASNSLLKAANNSAGEDHPDYRGIAFIEFKDLLFGREKVSAPSIEVVVSRAATQALCSGTELELDDGQSNPIATIAELMTNTRYGLGMPTTLFDASTFQTTAEALYARKDLTFCSPFLNQQASLREVIAEVSAMTDCFLKWDTSQAKIVAGYWEHGDTPDLTGLVSIGEADLTETPDFDASGWSGISTGWDITFSDRTRMYKDSSEKYDDVSLIELTGERIRENLNRPYITRRNQALAHAAEWGKTVARPSLSGEIVIRRRRAALLTVGELFKLDIDVEPGGEQLIQVCRCLEKSADQTGSVTVKFSAETNLIPLSYTPAVVPFTDSNTFPEPAQFAYVRPIEMPPAFADTEYGIAVLAQREDNLTVGYNVLYDKAVDGAFTNIGTIRSFGVCASLLNPYLSTTKGADEAGYDPATNPLILDVLDSNTIDLASMPDDVGLDGARADQFLLILAELDNRVVNGDFSNGTTGWSFTPGSGTPAPTFSAVDGEGVCINSDVSGTGSTLSIDSQSVLAGKRYVVTFRAKTEVAGDLIYAQVTNQRDSDGSWTWASFDGIEADKIDGVPGSTEWTTYTMGITATYSTALRFLFIADFNNDGGNTWIDSLRIVEETKPIKLDADGFAITEILSVSAVSVETEGTRTIQALRGRFSTGTRNFSSGAEAWLVRRASVKVFTHEDFATEATAESPIYFKTEPYNIFKTRDIADDGSVEFTFATARFFAPKIAFDTLPVLGPYVGSDYVVSGVITDQDGDLSSWSLSYIDTAGNETVVAGSPIDPTTSFAFSVPIKFPIAGTFDIVVRAKDSTTFIDSYVEERVTKTASVATSVVGVPTTITTTTGFNMIWLNWTNPTDPDLAIIEVYESASNDISTASLVASTGAEFCSVAINDTITHYFWLRSKDISGNYSAFTPGDTSGITGTARGSVTGSEVDAAGVEVVSVLPTTGLTDGRVVYLTTDKKIYRYIAGTGWSSSSAATDITGQIVADQITAGSIAAVHVGANEIIASEANIQNGIITSAKIASLTADKIAAGTIGAVKLTMGGAASIIESSTFTDTAGYQLKGDGSAIFANMEIRKDTVVASGTGNFIKSANYVPGASGWAIRGDGFAEFWDINVYGSVPLPQVFAGATELTSGSSYTNRLDQTVVTIVVVAGTTAYYRTDGGIPSGLSSELVPESGEITITGRKILRTKSFEDTTGRSSGVFSAEFFNYLPIISSGTPYLRTYEYNASYPGAASNNSNQVRWSTGGSSTVPPSFTSATFNTVFPPYAASIYYNTDGSPNGLAYNIGTTAAVWFIPGYANPYALANVVFFYQKGTTLKLYTIGQGVFRTVTILDRSPANFPDSF